MRRRLANCRALRRHVIRGERRERDMTHVKEEDGASAVRAGRCDQLVDVSVRIITMIKWFRVEGLWFTV